MNLTISCFQYTSIIEFINRKQLKDQINVPVGDILSGGILLFCLKYNFRAHVSDFSSESQKRRIQPLVITSLSALNF